MLCIIIQPLEYVSKCAAVLVNVSVVIYAKPYTLQLQQTHVENDMPCLTLHARAQRTQVMSVSYSLSGSWISEATLTAHKNNPLHLASWGRGSGFRGDGVGEESIRTLPILISTVQQGQFIWKHSPALLLRGHSSTIRAQCKPEAASRRRGDQHKHREGLSLTTTRSTKLVSVTTFFCWHKSRGQNTPTSLLTPDGWAVCTSVSYVTVCHALCFWKSRFKRFCFI